MEPNERKEKKKKSAQSSQVYHSSEVVRFHWTLDRRWSGDDLLFLLGLRSNANWLEAGKETFKPALAMLLLRCHKIKWVVLL
jgi:hypothetical protein